MYVLRTISLVAVVGAGLAQHALAQSAKSCGGAGDHFKNPVVTLTPDPPVPGQPMTINVQGDLDETVNAGSVDVDLNIVALHIIKSDVKMSTPFSITPTPFVAGHVNVQVGPFDVLKTPGSTVVGGQIRAKNDKGEPVLCVELDLKVGGGLPEMTVPSVTESALGAVESCSQPTDHVKNFSLDTSGGKISVTGQLDEDLTTFNIGVDTVLKKLLLKIPCKMNIPVTCTPKLPAGDFKLEVGPATGGLSPDPKVSLSGKITMADKKNEEVFCLNIDEVLENNDMVV